MTTKRQQLLELEQIVENELNSENSEVVVRCGYDSLTKYLLDKRDIDPLVTSRAYKYWTFLTLLRIVADPTDFEDESVVLFSPERSLQSGAGPRVFVEPSLPTYSKEQLWNEASTFTYLQNPTENSTIHDTPNKILVKNDLDWLPWPANRGPVLQDLSELRRLCASGEYEQVVDKLGIETTPSSFAECQKLVEKYSDTVSESEIDREWKDFSENVEYLIDCNHGSLSEDDYSRILWYGIAYEQPLLIVTSERITDRQFKDDLEMLPAEVSVVENFSIDLGPSDSSNKLKQIIN